MSIQLVSLIEDLKTILRVLFKKYHNGEKMKIKDVNAEIYMK